jgi:hypothetical protein
MGAIRRFDESPSIFIRDTPILSSETMLHTNYNRKVSVANNSLVEGLKELEVKMN